MSYIEFDINKHTTDLLGLYRYVAAKVHRHHFVGGWAGLEIPRYALCSMYKHQSQCLTLINTHFDKKAGF